MTAIAQELAGRIWEIVRHVPIRTEPEATQTIPLLKLVADDRQRSGNPDLRWDRYPSSERDKPASKNGQTVESEDESVMSVSSDQNHSALHIDHLVEGVKLSIVGIVKCFRNGIFSWRGRSLHSNDWKCFLFNTG
ncbi:hypothetical protein BLA27_24680 [Brucella cytisi]|uniref:Uncharacterized protein n=1 Tax=Brucella cytisi TaxID=407152 RepID=A0A1J6HCG3_9HYPH|nr:hypothetical protein BLA27_24680 [Brucella cytisi]